jgi:single-strand DNA-binding protein
MTDLRMPSINSIAVSGRLAGEVHFRTLTGTGRAVATFSIALIAKSKKSADAPTEFIDVTFWEKQAELCRDYLKKGSPVYIEGVLRQERWEGEKGEKHSKHSITGKKIQFLSYREKEEEKPAEVPAEKPIAAPAKKEEPTREEPKPKPPEPDEVTKAASESPFDSNDFSSGDDFAADDVPF